MSPEETRDCAVLERNKGSASHEFSSVFSSFFDECHANLVRLLVQTHGLTLVSNESHESTDSLTFRITKHCWRIFFTKSNDNETGKHQK